MEKDLELTVEIEQAIHGQSTDWFLQKLVSTANNAGLEIGITLYIGSGVISGTLIGGKRYFDKFAEEFSSNWPFEDKEQIREVFASQGETYNEPVDENSPPPQYIHLMNARLYSQSGCIPGNSGVLWRGKINAISGFNIGLLSIN